MSGTSNFSSMNFTTFGLFLCVFAILSTQLLYFRGIVDNVRESGTRLNSVILKKTKDASKQNEKLLDLMEAVADKVNEGTTCECVVKGDSGVVVNEEVGMVGKSTDSCFASFIMPWRPRTNADYLQQVLRSYQVGGSPDIEVHIWNIWEDSSEWGKFNEAAEMFSDVQNFHFHPFDENKWKTFFENLPPITERAKSGYVSALNEAQSSHIGYIMTSTETTCSHVVITEDDFEMCPGGSVMLKRMIDEADGFKPNWICIRISFGGAGLVFPREDGPVVGRYLAKHRGRRPSDHLLMEWYNSEVEESIQQVQHRQRFLSRVNLLDHVGVVSTKEHKAHVGRKYPVCYGRIWYVFGDWEVFEDRVCGVGLLDPCEAQEREAAEAARKKNFN